MVRFVRRLVKVCIAALAAGTIYESRSVFTARCTAIVPSAATPSISQLPQDLSRRLYLFCSAANTTPEAATVPARPEPSGSSPATASQYAYYDVIEMAVNAPADLNMYADAFVHCFFMLFEHKLLAWLDASAVSLPPTVKGKPIDLVQGSRLYAWSVEHVDDGRHRGGGGCDPLRVPQVTLQECQSGIKMQITLSLAPRDPPFRARSFEQLQVQRCSTMLTMATAIWPLDDADRDVWWTRVMLAAHRWYAKVLLAQTASRYLRLSGKSDRR